VKAPDENGLAMWGKISTITGMESAQGNSMAENSREVRERSKYNRTSEVGLEGGRRRLVFWEGEGRRE